MSITAGRQLVSALSVSLVCIAVACAQPPAREHSPLGSAPHWTTGAVRAPGVQYRTFDSVAAGCLVSYHVYLPDEYGTEPERRFPVLYWLHGSLGGLRGIAPLAAHFGDAMRAGLIPPMIVVFPNGLRLSLWVDSKDGSVPMETVVVKELLPDVDANLRTIPTREGRIVEGFSMGGYGAARFGLKYHDLFGAVSVLSGGPLQQEFTHGPRLSEMRRKMVLQAVFGGDYAYFRALSPWVLAEENADAVRETMRMRLVIGELDEMLAVTREFHAHLAELGIPHSFTVLPGIGHDPRAVLLGLGDAGWAFYREALAPLRDAVPAD